MDEVTIIHPSSRSYYGQYRGLSFSVYDGATGLHIWFHCPGEWDDDEVAAVLQYIKANLRRPVSYRNT